MCFRWANQSFLLYIIPAKSKTGSRRRASISRASRPWSASSCSRWTIGSGHSSCSRCSRANRTISAKWTCSSWCVRCWTRICFRRLTGRGTRFSSRILRWIESIITHTFLCFVQSLNLITNKEFHSTNEVDINTRIYNHKTRTESLKVRHVRQERWFLVN